jgi:broad specificity phosphatase PhoE
MRALLICLIAGLMLSACASSTHARDEYTLYLVRHAEKVTDGSRDPDLTDAGRARAIKIAARLENKGIEDIWSSDYQRTRETAAALAKELGLEIKIYNPGEQDKLLAQLKERHNNALIVGHSNTIPELARLLCACEVADMEETEYDRLIVVSISNGEVVLQTLKQ